jgi:uncharacterized protein YhjY with autotransporter beta-barrel domain
MKIIKLSRIATALGMALTLNQVQAATLVMDDRQPMPADAKFAGKTFLWEVNRTSDFVLNDLLGNLTGDYDGVRYSSKFNNVYYVDVPNAYSVDLSQYKYLQNFYIDGTDSNTDIFKMIAARATGTSPDNPTINPYQYSLRTLNLDNIHLQVTDNPALGSIPNAMPELLIYDAINLNSSKLTMGKVTGGGSSVNKLYFLDDHEINVTGAGNVIEINPATWTSISVGAHSTSLNIAAGSDLTITNGTNIFNEFNGNLAINGSTGSGSTLNIDASQVVLTSELSNPKFKPSVIDNATVNISGTFGSSYASLQLTNPTIRNSTITLDNNTFFRSSRRFTGGNSAGVVNFEGDNTITLGDGATFIGQAEGSAPTSAYGSFYFENGTTTINGNGVNAPNFQADTWFIDNATVNLSNVAAETYVTTLNISNSAYKGRGVFFDNLSTLSVTDSSISGSVNFGNNGALIWLNNSSIIAPGFSTQDGGTEKYAQGMTFDFGTAIWQGNNTFISNIDPNGTEVVVGTGIKSYSNQLFIKRANVTGFDTLNIELKSVDYSLLASDYATGGAASDGIYDLVLLQDGATTDADPSITLDGNFPALLTAGQVNRASANSPVQVQLVELPAQTLVLQPTITPAHQETTISQVVVEPDSGNTVATNVTITPDNTGGATQVVTTTTTTPDGGTQVSTSTSTLQPATGSNNLQNAANLLANSHYKGNTDTINNLGSITNSELASHFNSIHAEPYSSNMTVALEHTDAVMNSVFSQLRKKSFSPKRDEATKDVTAITRQGMWLDAGYIKGDVEGEDNLGNFDYSLSHLTLGFDVAEFDKATLGVYLSAGSYDMDEHDRAVEDFSNDAYHFGVYFNQPDVGQLKLRSLLGYAYGDHSSSRLVQLSDTTSNATADFNSYSVYAGVMATMNWYSNDWVSLSPDLAFNYVYFEQEGFSEKGDPSLSLKLDDSDAQSIITSVGLSATFSSLSRNHAIYPEAYIRYEHDWYARKNNEHKVSAGLVSNPNYKQDFEGQSRGENSIIVGLGLTSDVTSALQINGEMTVTESTHGSESGGSISANYKW